MLAFGAACAGVPRGHVGSAGGCVIAAEAAQVRALAVTAGTERFVVSLRGARLEVVAPEQGSVAQVAVHWPLAFDGDALLSELELRVARTVRVSPAGLWIGQGASPEWLGVRGTEMLFSVENYLGIASRPALRLPCDAVTLSSGSSPMLPAVTAGAGPRVGLGASFFELHRAPRAPEVLEASYPGAFELLEERDGWAAVRAAWADGSRLEGWVRRSRLVADFEPPTRTSPGETLGATCSGGHPPARYALRVGAGVAAAPNGPVWAHAAADAWVEAATVDGEQGGWVQLARIEGVGEVSDDPCVAPSHFWVRAQDLAPAP